MRTGIRRRARAAPTPASRAVPSPPLPRRVVPDEPAPSSAARSALAGEEASTLTPVTPGPPAPGDSSGFGAPTPRARRALRAAAGQGDLSWGIRNAVVPWLVVRVVVTGA